MIRRKPWMSAIFGVALAIAMVANASEGTPLALSGGDDAVLIENCGYSRPFMIRTAIDTPTPVTYGDPILISFLITQDARAEAVTGVYINPKGNIVDVYMPNNASLPATVSKSAGKVNGTQCVFDGDNIKAGVPFLVECSLSPRPFLDSFLRMIFMRPARQKMGLTVIVPEADNGGILREVEYHETIEIDFSSPNYAVITGGFAGAMLLSIFMLLTAPDSVPSKEAGLRWPVLCRHFFRSLLSIFRQTILGGVCALVLIVMAQSVGGFAPPISIRIHDVWGGLLVGLLSMPLAKWLRAKLSTMGETSKEITEGAE